MARLRVLLVSFYFDRIGGLEAYNINTARALAKHGAEVKAVSVLTTGSGHCEGIATRGMLPRRPALARVYRQYWGKVLALYLRSLREPYDLAIAGHLFLLPQVSDFARRRGIPCWVSVFGIEAWADWTEAVRQGLVASDRIIAISRFTADSVAKRLDDGIRRVEIVSPMVDVDTFVPRGGREADSRLRVLTVGRLSSRERYKGHEVVMAALPMVMQELGRPVEYWIVGDGDDRPRLEEVAKREGIEATTRFCGRVGLDELVGIYNGCDVFAMPSRVERRSDGSWTGEGFGIVYIEAAACEKPVIAAKQGGASETVEDGVSGLLVEPTAAEVGRALCRILTDRALAMAMGKAGRAFVMRNFSLDVFEERWGALVKSLGA